MSRAAGYAIRKLCASMINTLNAAAFEATRGISDRYKKVKVSDFHCATHRHGVVRALGNVLAVAFVY